jgi:hypothetical protein
MTLALQAIPNIFLGGNLGLHSFYSKPICKVRPWLQLHCYAKAHMSVVFHPYRSFHIDLHTPISRNFQKACSPCIRWQIYLRKILHACLFQFPPWNLADKIEEKSVIRRIFALNCHRNHLKYPLSKHIGVYNLVVCRR